MRVLGSGFRAVTAVEFGGVPGTELTITSSGALLVTAPKRTAPGTVDVRIVSAYGTSTVTTDDRYAYVGPPTSAVTSQLAPGPDATSGAAGNVWVDAGCTGTSCYGVGVYDTTSSDVAIVETDAAGTWSWARAPLPADASTVAPLSELDAISCVAAAESRSAPTSPGTRRTRCTSRRSWRR